jgi:hypothetical protein
MSIQSTDSVILPKDEARKMHRELIARVSPLVFSEIQLSQGTFLQVEPNSNWDKLRDYI